MKMRKRLIKRKHYVNSCNLKVEVSQMFFISSLGESVLVSNRVRDILTFATSQSEYS